VVRRVVLTVLGVICVLGGLAAGAAAVWSVAVLGSDGVLRYGAGTITPGTASQATIIDVDRFSVSVPVVGALGDTTLSVTAPSAADPAAGAFIGAGTTRDVDAYLAGVPYSVALRDGTDWNVTDVPGGQPPLPPPDQRFWLAADSGPRAAIAVPSERPLTLVLMTPDGSPTGVLALSVDVTIASAGTYELWLSVTAAVLVAVGAVLLFLAFHRRRPRGRHAAGAAVVAVEPEAAEPEAAEPEVVEPEVVEPEAAEPESDPDVTQELPVLVLPREEAPDGDPG
jgi:hypothetical protein